MRIVIDGYNLLKAVFYKEKGMLDRQREALLRMLAVYHLKSGHSIAIVFDGGHSLHATRQVQQGVELFFSGQRRSADELITSYIARYKGGELLLVTRDCELRERNAYTWVEAIDVEDFYTLLVQSQELHASMLSVQPQGALTKYVHDEYVMVLPEEEESIDLLDDILMIEATRDMRAVQRQEDEGCRRQGRKRKGHTASKQEKRLKKKIGKL